MQNFKIGVILDSFKLPIPEAIKQAALVGAQGVQVYATRGDMSPEKMTPARISEFKDMLASNGLVISALCGDLGGHGFQIAENNAARIEQSKRIMDLALELGTNVVTTHIGVVPNEKIDRYFVLQEACDTLARYGAEVGAYFAIETGPEPSAVLKAFLDSLSAKNLCINLDPANLVMVIGESPVDAVRNLKDYIVHTHAKDGIMLKRTSAERIYGAFASDGVAIDIEEQLDMNEYFKEVPLGHGSVEFDTYLPALRDIGYSGFLTIEREVGDNPAADIALAVEFLRGRI